MRYTRVNIVEYINQTDLDGDTTFVVYLVDENNRTVKVGSYMDQSVALDVKTILHAGLNIIETVKHTLMF